MMNTLVGAVKMLPYKFAPRNYAYCTGSLMGITGNEQLFSLIGTTYGGDGIYNFALPDMRGRVPVHRDEVGNPDVIKVSIGEKGGQETVTLTLDQIPAHNHKFNVSSEQGQEGTPKNIMLANEELYADTATKNFSELSPSTVSYSGGGQPHNNMMPYLGMNFCIALAGSYPVKA